MKNKMLYVIFAISILVVIIIVAIVNNKNKEEINVTELEEGGEEYNSTHLDNFDLSIVNMNKDAINNINDVSNFKYKMKEFLYKNGNVDCTEARYETSNVQSGIMIIRFKLNDYKESSLIAKIYIENGEYEFVVY